MFRLRNAAFAATFRYIFIILSAALFSPAFGQNDDNATENKSTDTIAVARIEGSILEIWKLSPQATIRKPIYVDTSEVSFHRFHAGNADYALRESLGQHGQPGRSLKLSERESQFSAPYIQQFGYYFYSHYDRLQYNCRRPFTLIQYSVESKSGLNIDFFQVQNVNPYFNFGFELNYFNGEGHYLKTQHAGKMLRGFASYTGARHRAFLSTSSYYSSQIN